MSQDIEAQRAAQARAVEAAQESARQAVAAKEAAADEAKKAAQALAEGQEKLRLAKAREAAAAESARDALLQAHAEAGKKIVRPLPSWIECMPGVKGDLAPTLMGDGRVALRFCPARGQNQAAVGQLDMQALPCGVKLRVPAGHSIEVRSVQFAKPDISGDADELLALPHREYFGQSYHGNWPHQIDVFWMPRSLCVTSNRPPHLMAVGAMAPAQVQPGDVIGVAELVKD